MSITTGRGRLVSFFALLCLIAVAGCGRSSQPRTHSAPVITHDAFLRKATVDGRVIAFADTGNWQSELKYVAVLDLPAHCMIAPGRALLLGLGGGSVARNYRRQGWTVDVVEPDTARVTLARRAFGFSDSVRVVITSERDFLEREGTRYDVILLDCVSADAYPVDMLTKEAFALAAGRLTDNGIFAVAVESNGWKDEIVRVLSATLGASFRQVVVLPIVEPPNMFGTIVLMASNTVRNDLLRDPERNLDYSPEWRYGPEYQKTHAWDNHFTIPPDGMPLQTDGHNSWSRILADLRAASQKAPNNYLP